MARKPKETPFLTAHKSWSERGRMDRGGLCCTHLPYTGVLIKTIEVKKWKDENGKRRRKTLHKTLHPLEILDPSPADFDKLIREGLDTHFWGCGLPTNSPERMYTYTPLRQNIVLLCAALNGEL